jgi:hypothetical protein
MSNEVLGIKETTEVLNFGFDLLEAIIKSLEDKKFSIVTDAPRFVPVIFSAAKAFSGIELVKEELKDITEEEQQELIAELKKRFDLKNDNVEILIEDVLDHVFLTVKLAKRFSALK